MKPGPGFFVTLDPTAPKCSQADPAIPPSPLITSAPALQAPLVPRGQSACVQSGPGTQREGKGRPAQPPGREVVISNQGPQHADPTSLQPDLMGTAVKGVSSGLRQHKDGPSLTCNSDLPGSSSRSSGQGLCGCTMLEGDPSQDRGSPRSASMGCFLSFGGSLPRRRNGSWREGGREKQRGRERPGLMKGTGCPPSIPFCGPRRG